MNTLSKIISSIVVCYTIGIIAVIIKMKSKHGQHAGEALGIILVPSFLILLVLLFLVIVSWKFFHHKK